MDCVTTGAQIESHSILHACYRYIRAPTHRAHSADRADGRAGDADERSDPG